jgi:hypothetical protein
MPKENNSCNNALWKTPKCTDRDTKAQPRKLTNGNLVKFVIYGEEMIEKIVNASGNSGRVYLPLDWVGRRVKIARVD